ncbi:hypothetical protein FPQ18DRAFT_144912 [Pyronema domesticum]|uniref:Probable endonuclease LCL3 n=1 Tax=Pyronema omphalodes (strain CBS 100304) TaxID=1076935 RepID=U4KWM9_PYROM|nr:hypothetical protein FPQ18DRAFT_144912 [Pyronema domesticum]CCX05601.1 Similar to Staphylococcal nuclease domain-containing protein 1; acc. no. Q9Y7U7 [Pyronema omphalodes CBS 100304]
MIIATVKAVTSGDTVVLKSTKSGAEKVLSLAFISAPRLRREGDEPYAFKAREFIRREVVNTSVQFKVLYNVPQINREYGVIVLEDGRNLAEVLVHEGMVKVREDSGKRGGDADSEEGILLQKLQIYEEQARDAEKGVWSKDEDGRVEAIYENPTNPTSFLEMFKGKEIDAIIERVISGDRFSIRLILEPKKHQYILLLLAGVRTPQSTRIDANQMVHQGEEYGDEAKDFVETRLLMRTVKVQLLGVSPQGQLVGSVLHHNGGNIAEILASHGLARCVDFHSAFLGSAMARLRDAEKYAKDKKLRIYKGLVTKKRDSNNEFEAVVARIISADTIVVRNKAGAERKINLSSIRQPKPSDPAQSPFQADAKEFLRKKLIGKHVRIHIDGKRPAQEGYEEREMATVTFGDKNVALGLVEAGYASVIRHRATDEDRSPIWDDLAAAEDVARSAQKGMYSPKAPQTAKMIEASETIQKAKSYLSFLQRQKKVPAVVDYVASGSRFKVIIPKENARLTFVLSGIKAPRTARNPTEQSEPFGPEALDYVSKRTMQRDVEIDVLDIDRVGGFIGTMYINGQNVARGLVEEGLASVNVYSAEKTGHANELLAAENKAKAAHKGMWHDWSPEKEAAEAAEAAGFANASYIKPTETIQSRADFRDIMVSHFDVSGNLKLQIVGEGTAKLEAMMLEFRRFYNNPANSKPLDGMPKAGMLVAAKFSDGSFYRAKIKHCDRVEKEAEVLYIDYGNTERVSWTDLRPLAPHFSTEKLKAQTVDAVWSFIKFPGLDMLNDDVREFVSELTENKQLVANVDHIKADGTLMVTILEPGATGPDDSINRTICQEGFAYVPKKLGGLRDAYGERIKGLEEAMKEAEQGRLGMWRFGDVREDEE